MKIGILTFHCADNYGAVLQGYALAKFLRKNGFDAEIINYQPDYLTSVYSIFPPLKLPSGGFSKKLKRLARYAASTARSLLLFPWLYGRKRAFSSFVGGNIALSGGAFKKMSELKKHYDIVIFGSDQIWSRPLNNEDPAFFGIDRSFESSEKMAYAASAGGSVDKLANNAQFRMGIKNFYAVSAREEELSNLVRSFGIKCDTVIDPTFLLPSCDWGELCRGAECGGKYILVYEVSQSPMLEKIARKISKKTGAKIIRVWAGYRKDATPFSFKMSAGPLQFLSLIKNAFCVITTSFHGVAFSTIFQRDFYFVSAGSPDENRITQLLSTAGLLDRILTSESPVDFKAVKWGEIDNSKLSSHIKLSEEYLLKNLRK